MVLGLLFLVLSCWYIYLSFVAIKRLNNCLLQINYCDIDWFYCQVFGALSIDFHMLCSGASEASSPMQQTVNATRTKSVPLRCTG